MTRTGHASIASKMLAIANANGAFNEKHGTAATRNTPRSRKRTILFSPLFLYSKS